MLFKIVFGSVRRRSVVRWVLVAVLAVILNAQGVTPAPGWPPLPNGCYYTGSSECGGSDRNRCAPHQRFLSHRCGNQITNACGLDDLCARQNKGRVLLQGSWHDAKPPGVSFEVNQLGDIVNVWSRNYGQQHGRFTGPYTFSLGTVTGAYHTDTNRITFSNGAVWVR
jgi:hypothetical protein